MMQYFKKDNELRAFNVENGKVITTITIGGQLVINPSLEQFEASGWQPYEIPAPTPYIPTYEEKVVQLIRERYSIDDELAIQRQRDSKPQEFAEYNAFCEECKQKAKAEE